MSPKARCLILGGSGFLGQNMAKRLISDGYQVVVVDKVPIISPIKDAIDFINADVMDVNVIKNIVQKGDILFYFACTSLPGSPFEQIQNNIHQDIEGFIRVMIAAIDNQVGKIVFPSSGGTVYGEPLSLPIKEDHATNPICYYGVTKLIGEKYLYMFNKTRGLEYLIFRIGNPYGPGQDPERLQGLIPKAIKRTMINEKIEVFGNGECVRDYIYIDDVVNAIVKSVDAGLKNDIYNLGSGSGASINNVLGTIASVLQKKPQIEYVEKRRIDVSANILSIEKLSAALGWKPKIPLEEGIRLTHKWLMENGGNN